MEGHKSTSDFPSDDRNPPVTPSDDVEKPPHHVDAGSSTAPTSEEGVQDGVRNMEAISQSWTKSSLIVAYVSIMLMAIVTSLDGQVTSAVTSFATSSFNEHSLVSTVAVVQGIVNAVVKPPMAKVADVFGRLEAYTICIVLYVIGYIQMAASKNVGTFASAQIFYSAGFTGQSVLQQVFIADTSDLLNRALFSSLPDLPFLVTTWVGSPIAQHIRKDSGWRWCYAMWTIILPVSFLPLAVSLFLNNRRAKKMGLTVPVTTLQGGPVTVAKNLWRDLDLGGILLLSAGFALLLLPCTIAAKAAGGWSNPSMIAMITVGAVLLVIFLIWESTKNFANSPGLPESARHFLRNLAPYPLIPLHLMKDWTFSAGCVIALFYFIAYYLSVQPYFNSYLLVVHNKDITTAGYITMTFNFASTVASIVVSLFIKYSRRYKWFVTLGSCVYLLGMGLMIRYRTLGASTGTLVGTQICIGIGGGMLNVPAQLGVQASAGHQNVGIATAVFLTLISVGGAIGAAISGAIWTELIPQKLAAYLPAANKGDAIKIFGDVDVARSYPLGSAARDAINQSYQETMTTLLTIAVCMCVPMILASLVMADYKLDEMEQGVKGQVIGGTVTEDEKKEKNDTESKARKMDPRTWFNKKNNSTDEAVRVG